MPATVEIAYEGQLADYDTRILTLSVLKGLFGGVSDEPVTFVNAPQLAKEHGVEVRETSTRHVGRLRQPDHRPRAAATSWPARCRAGGASPAS